MVLPSQRDRKSSSKESNSNREEVTINEQRPNDPCPVEMRLICQVIQSRWTEKERHKRAAWAYQWEPVGVCEVAEAEAN